MWPCSVLVHNLRFNWSRWRWSTLFLNRVSRNRERIVVNYVVVWRVGIAQIRSHNFLQNVLKIHTQLIWADSTFQTQQNDSRWSQIPFSSFQESWRLRCLHLRKRSAHHEKLNLWQMSFNLLGFLQIHLAFSVSRFCTMRFENCCSQEVFTNDPCSNNVNLASEWAYMPAFHICWGFGVCRPLFEHFLRHFQSIL